MYEQYTAPIGPTCRGPNGHVRAPLRYKKEALAVHDRLSRTLSDARWTQLQADPDSSNTIHSGRRVLRSGGPNHSKLVVFIVFLSEIELVASYPLSSHPLGLGGCIPPPSCGLPHHDSIVYYYQVPALADSQ